MDVCKSHYYFYNYSRHESVATCPRVCQLIFLEIICPCEKQKNCSTKLVECVCDGRQWNKMFCTLSTAKLNDLFWDTTHDKLSRTLHFFCYCSKRRKDLNRLKYYPNDLLSGAEPAQASMQPSAKSNDGSLFQLISYVDHSHTYTFTKHSKL